MNTPFPPLVPRPLPPDGLSRVVAEGRRRRRAYAARGASALSVAVAALLVLPGGGGTDRITPLDESPSPAPTATASPSGSPAVAAPPASPPPSPDRSKPASPTEPPSAEPSRIERTIDPGPLRFRWQRPMSYAEVPHPEENRGKVCMGEMSLLAELPEWCLEVGRSAPTVSVGEPVTITVAVCRTAGYGPGTLNFASTKEADIFVTRAGEDGEVWRWSTGLKFRDDEHSRTIQEGNCGEWTTTWNGTDENGEPLPAGRYSVWVETTASDADGPLQDYAALAAPVDVE